jgi:gluconate 2-dehydrogenase gamma chain
MKRRQFITLPVKSLFALRLYTLAGGKLRGQSQNEIDVPLRFFTAAEAQVVQAACERILPADESGPGATDAGVVIYIDRQLAGPYGRDEIRYAKGPWFESLPEHGYQGKESPQELYRQGIPRLGGNFTELPPAEQDARLQQIEDTVFFELLKEMTVEGMFCDPLHGGNAGMVGWKLVGFPGPLMSYRDEIEAYHDKPFVREPRSLTQIVGHEVKGWEEES